MPFWKRKQPSAPFVIPSASRLSAIDAEIDAIQKRMRVEHSNTELWVRSKSLHWERDLIQWRASGVVRGYRTLAAPDSCPACKNLAKLTFHIDDPCPLPCPECSNANYGFCRCSLAAIIDVDE